MEKPSLTTHVTEESIAHKSRKPRESSWNPSLLRIAPLTGLAALLFAFLQIWASYAILKASDGELISSWKYEPNVYLAVLTAISNKALAFALVQGTVVTFWLKAVRGTTLAQLHRDWGFGLHVYKALLAGKNFNVLALACICATFVAIGELPDLRRYLATRLATARKTRSLTAVR